MERNITAQLLNWSKEHSHKPLIIRGARQVGKTFTIREFGNRYFPDNFIEFNFERDNSLNTIFKNDLNPQKIITELEIYSDKDIEKGKTLLFFDEIQSCPRAILALRYFYEEIPDLHIIAAGSLLEFSLGNISFPVGRVELLKMHPMNFSEFILAMGHRLILKKVSNINLLTSDIIHSKLTVLLNQYFIIGGMPEAVSEFIKTQNYRKVRKVHSNLLETYYQDFNKYNPKVDTTCLSTVFTSVAQNTGSQIKYSRLCNNFSNPTIHKAFDALRKANLFTVVKAASPAGLPLEAGVSSKKFKTIFLDIGLLSYFLGGITSNISGEKLLPIFKGAIAEQFVGQELLSVFQNVYYWARNSKSSMAEVDYLVNYKSAIIPIEVKSGAKGRLKSLHILFDSYPDITKAFVFNENKYILQDADKIHFLPLYVAGMIIRYIENTPAFI